MDLRKIKTLLQLMNENALAEMELEEEGLKVKFSKFGAGAPAASVAYMPAPVPVAGAAGSPPSVSDAELDGHLITSPIPGTFYAASGPDKPPFVKVGDSVEPGTVVCIVEAMKVMNEIKAECRGKILEILVQNAEPVEYGKPLFRIAEA
ncbi:MAG: acetyl-CoA carboxylase biotin carboxyl carrier protein [Planctomycetota bacterium]